MEITVQFQVGARVCSLCDIVQIRLQFAPPAMLLSVFAHNIVLFIVTDVKTSNPKCSLLRSKEPNIGPSPKPDPFHTLISYFIKISLNFITSKPS
jgi:hypothetical protein